MKSYLFWILSGVQNLFGVSYKQAKGILVLQFLILVMLLSPIFFSYFFPKPIIGIQPSDEKQLNDLIAQWEKTDKSTQIDAPTFTNNQSEPAYFPFDPNIASEEQLVNMGFPGWLAERLINYRNAGGRFTIKSDIKNVYGLQDWLYNRIEDYIELPDEIDPELAKIEIDTKVYDKSEPSGKVEEVERNTTEEDLPLLLDINLADSIELQKIRGIGPAFSSRIVRFRDILGGFSSMEQLKEVYGLSEDTYESIKPFITLSEDYKLSKLSINFANQAELSSHPYINYNTARALVNYRNQHGPFKNAEDLGFVKVLSDSIIQKISPYLDFSTNEDSHY